MSFKLMAQAMDIEVGNSTRKLVLLKLADQANDDGFCFPSVATIRKACEIKSDNTVRSHIKALVKQGFVRVEKRWNSEKQCNYSNSYYLTLDGNEKNLGTSTVEPPTPNNEVGGTANNEGSTSNIEPEPINEPINIEPITKPKKNNTKKRKHSIPDDFQIGEQVIQICNQYGIDPNLWQEEFISSAKAKDYKYVNWQQACKNWLVKKISQNKLQPIPTATAPVQQQVKPQGDLEAGKKMLEQMRIKVTRNPETAVI